MGDLFLMIGCPGSGKTTFLKNNVKNYNSEKISRDEIRFSLLGNNDSFFSHEDEVRSELWRKINAALAAGKNVFVDQTSLTLRSREYLLTHINGYDHINAIWIDTPLEICLQRNETRIGTKTYVPPFSLRKMFFQLTPPSFKEGYNTIYHYDGVGNKITYMNREDAEI